MSYETEYGIRWPVKPWGPLNKAGRLENAPPARTLAEAQSARILNDREYWGRLLQCKNCEHVQIAGPSDHTERCHLCSAILSYRAPKESPGHEAVY
jgi:ribosomal protein S27E